MVAQSTEEMIQELRNIMEAQNKKIQHLQDVHEIANLMGRYIYYHTAGMDAQLPDLLYAQKTPGVTFEVAHMGAYDGIEGVKRALGTYGRRGPDGKIMEGDPATQPGALMQHTLTTPVIEVAGDGKTAKGIWISPGHESGKDPQTGEFRAFWCWTKYGCDFVKEDGQWKVWHYHVYRIFRSPFEEPWTNEYELKHEMILGEGDKGKGGFGADRPSTYDNPYSRTTVQELVPAPPDPYETFDPAKAY